MLLALKKDNKGRSMAPEQLAHDAELVLTLTPPLGH